MDSKLTSQNRWDVMESITGTYVQNQVQNDMVEVRFTRPVPIKEHSRYAIRLCSQGAKTCFGDAGVSSLRGPCGVTFSFYPCDLSFNGTTPNRGQLPSLLYYSSPRRRDGQTGKIIGEIHARDIALQIAREITHQGMDILKHVREIIECGYYSDKSFHSANVHCVDSEHNITPIEEHLDVSCAHRPEFIAEGSSMSLATRELTKKFESFTKGIVDTLKAKTNPFECEIATDVVGQEGRAPEEAVANDQLRGEYLSFYSRQQQQQQPQHRVHEEDDEEEGGDDDDEDGEDNDGVGDSSHMNTAQLLEVFGREESALFHTLLPAVMALIGPLVSSDPKSTVQILSIIRQVIPHVAALNQQQIMSGLTASTPSNDSPNDQFGEEDLLNENQPDSTDQLPRLVGAAEKGAKQLGSTTSSHYCVVECEHPYKSASILTCRVDFPPCVQWFTIEFDSQCGTVQTDDYLNVSIPTQALANGSACARNAVRCDAEGQQRPVESVSSVCSMADDNGGVAAAAMAPGRDDNHDDWIVVKKLNR